MKVRYPDYYKKFRCIAGECPDTCCAGWEIAVDRNSEKQYRDLQKQGKISNRDFAKKLKKYVKDGRILSEDVTCPFLNPDGLCEMYLELGPESLCHTCARHPRHLEDYGNLHEMVLLLSCPEVARLVLEENGGGFYVRDLPEKQGNMDGIDEELSELLLRVRDLIWKIGRDDSMTMNLRMAFSLALAHDVQRCLIPRQIVMIERVLERYEKAGAEKRFFAQWNRKSVNSDTLMTDFIDEFGKLELICKVWPEMMQRMRDCSRRSEEHPDYANVFAYFLYSFFMAALYDEDMLTKVKMAVMCTMMVEMLYASAVEELTTENRVSICHALARQIENSDANRFALEAMLKGNTFSARRIIDALL